MAFESIASKVVAGDTNAVSDIFVYDRCVASWSNYGAGWPGTLGVPSIASSADPVPSDPVLCGIEVDLQTLELDAGASKGVSFTPGLELPLGH